MKHIFIKKALNLLVITLISAAATAQNFFPIRWKIQSADKTVGSDSIDFNRSWQSQGLCDLTGGVVFASNFNVAKKQLKLLAGKDLSLTLNMQCQIDSLVINGYMAVDNLAGQAGRKMVEVPLSVLVAGTNHAFIYARQFTRTAGEGSNVCQLEGMVSASEVDIEIAPKNHLFVDSVPTFNVKWNSTVKQNLEIAVFNEFNQKVYYHHQRIKKPAEGNVPVRLDGLAPGFYQCCSYLTGGDEAGATQWISYNPQQIACRPQPVDGYSEYWQKAIEELDLIDPYYTMHKVDSLSRGEKDGFVVEFQSIGDVTIRAYLFLPRNRKENPVILHLPNHNEDFSDVVKRSYRYPNIAEMFLCVRGHGISRDEFDPQKEGGPGIWGWKIYDLQDNSYRGIYMDCLRAVDFITQDYHFDNSRIAVTGSGQGGGLALATASLCKGRIAALAYFNPFLCDIEHFLKTRPMYRIKIDSYLDYYNNTHTFDDVMKVLRMTDVLDMVRDIDCRTFFVSTLFDDDCPPHAGFAAFSLINAPKEYVIHLNRSSLNASYSDEMIKYLVNILEK